MRKGTALLKLQSPIMAPQLISNKSYEDSIQTLKNIMDKTLINKVVAELSASSLPNSNNITTRYPWNAVYDELLRFYVAQLLAGALDKDPPVTRPYDALMDLYVVERIKNNLPHLSACQEVVLDLIDIILDQDTRRISSADTAELGEESSQVDEDLKIT